MPGMPVPSLGDVVQAVELLTQALDAVKGKLFRETDKARDRLGVVLIGLEATFSALNSELTRYLRVMFDPTVPVYDLRNVEERAILVDLEGGAIRARVNQVRIHCSQIHTIYREDLERWLAPHLQKEEAKRLEKAFLDLDSVDGKLGQGMESLGEWISDHATEILQLVDGGQLEAANEELKQQCAALKPLRKQLMDIMVTLQRLSFEALQEQ